MSSNNDSHGAKISKVRKMRAQSFADILFEHSVVPYFSEAKSNLAHNRCDIYVEVAFEIVQNEHSDTVLQDELETEYFKSFFKGYLGNLGYKLEFSYVPDTFIVTLKG